MGGIFKTPPSEPCQAQYRATRVCHRMTSHLHHWHRNDLASTRGSASLLPQNDPCSVCGFVGSAGVTWCSVCSCTHCVACGHCPSSQTGLQGVTSHHSGPLHMAQQNSGLQQLCLGWRLSLVWLLGLTLALAAIALAGCSPCPHHSQWHTDSCLLHCERNLGI